MKSTIKLLLVCASLWTIPALYASQGDIKANTQLPSITNPWFLQKAWLAQEKNAAPAKIYTEKDFNNVIEQAKDKQIQKIYQDLKNDLSSKNTSDLNIAFQQTADRYQAALLRDCEKKQRSPSLLHKYPVICEGDIENPLRNTNITQKNKIKLIASFESGRLWSSEVKKIRGQFEAELKQLRESKKNTLQSFVGSATEKNALLKKLEREESRFIENKIFLQRIAANIPELRVAQAQQITPPTRWNYFARLRDSVIRFFSRTK